MYEADQFQGKTVIVTGAAHGIGFAIAKAFARCKAHVVLVDIEAGALREAKEACAVSDSASASTFVADVADAQQILSLVQEVHAQRGGVDILVNNAGILPGSQDFEWTSQETWKRVLAINLMGVVNGCKAVIPIMKSQRGGRIINASSTYGVVPQYRSAPYCVSKAAIITITRILAAELGPFGVTVNAYAPGATHTRLAAHALVGKSGEEKLGEIPLGRFAEPEDIARVVLFLGSEEASYINGATLLVDGGALAIQSPSRISREPEE